MPLGYLLGQRMWDPESRQAYPTRSLHAALVPVLRRERKKWSTGVTVAL
jgi:hypothetical protein